MGEAVEAVGEAVGAVPGQCQGSARAVPEQCQSSARAVPEARAVQSRV